MSSRPLFAVNFVRAEDPRPLSDDDDAAALRVTKTMTEALAVERFISGLPTFLIAFQVKCSSRRSSPFFVAPAEAFPSTIKLSDPIHERYPNIVRPLPTEHNSMSGRGSQRHGCVKYSSMYK
jgi:hypothetical protein